MINEYAIYDMKDHEQLVYSGTMQEVADYLEMSKASIYSYFTRKRRGIRDLVKRRYEIVKVGEYKER